MELDWWSTKMSLVNGKSILTQEPDLVMETDASMLGWGAVCDGIRTGGLWTQVERRNHINYLELLAATFAVKAFTKDRHNLHVRLKMDNRTAICYVNRMGGTRSQPMSNLAIQLFAMVLGEESLPISSAPARDIQLCGRRGVQNSTVLSGMAPGSGNFSADSNEVRGMRCGPIRHTTQHPINTVCQLEARPECNWDRCTSNPLGQILRVCIPTVLFDWQMPQESQGGESTTVVDSPSVEVSSLVPSSVGPTGGLPSVITEDPNTADGI